MKREIEMFSSVCGASFQEAMISEWRKVGWKTTVFQAMGGEEYRKPRNVLGRLAVRWRMYCGYTLRCAIQARQKTGVFRFVTTNPFYAPLLMERAAGGRGLTINVMYDIFPDALIVAGVVKAGSLIARSCEFVTSNAMKRCAATVFLGDYLRSVAEERYGKARHSVVIPVGADGRPFRKSPPREIDEGDSVTVGYIGQMGRMHDIDTIRVALNEETPKGVLIRFFASGSAYKSLQKSARRGNSELNGPLAEEAWIRTMRDTHVGLVTERNGAERVVMPSKLYSAMVAGQAILAVCPRHSDLAELVNLHRCGWVIAPGDVQELRRTLVEISINRKCVQEMRVRSFEAGHRYYDAAIIARKWLSLCEELSLGQSY